MDLTPYIAAGVGGLILLGVIYVFLRNRSPRAKEEPYYHFNCPGCGRKLRYRARQAGHSGACPRCNRSCVFPAVKRS